MIFFIYTLPFKLTCNIFYNLNDEFFIIKTNGLTLNLHTKTIFSLKVKCA